MTPRIALIGFGAIGREVVGYLEPELARGAAELIGAVVRDPARYATPPAGGFITIDDACTADLVVECASVRAATRHAPVVIASGTDLVLTSIGALADPDVAAAVLGGPGEAMLTSGAIGGLDLVRAAAQGAGLDRVTITTTKTASSLVQPWMNEDAATRIRNLTEPELLFDGTPAEAIEKFPTNVNVAVALGVAARGLGDIAGGLARVRVRIVADPHTDTSTHVIEAEGSSGTYRFDIGNRPSAANPRTSALTAQAVAADVRAWLRRQEAHAHRYMDAHGRANAHEPQDAHGHANAHEHADAHGHANAHEHADAHGHANAHRHANAHGPQDEHPRPRRDDRHSDR